MVLNRLLASSVLAAVLVVGCSAGEGRNRAADNAEADNDAAESANDQERVPVEVTTLERGPMEAILRSSANLEAEGQVQVFSRTLGLVHELRVEEGDEVRSGQLLLRLDDEEQRARLDRVSLELAQARREHERQEGLFERELISEQAFNEATFQLEQLELALVDAQRELAYTQVRAPIAGTVTRRMVNLGDQVTPNQHLFDLIDFDSIVARIFVPERELARIRAGQEARVLARALGPEAYPGRVDRIAPVVDARSGTVKVTISVPRRTGLLPGMFVDVVLVTAVKPDALRLPKRALVYDADQTFVFRLTEDERVERLRVRAVLEDREHLEPADGLEPGDRVVVAGQAGLRHGMEVRVVDGAPEPARLGEAAEAES